MTGQLRVLDCEFCAPPVADPLSPWQPVAERIIVTHGEILLVVDRAPMTLGHVLMISREHHTGMASLMAKNAGAPRTICNITGLYRKAFGGCTVIEHGSGGAASAAGPCIDHAHLHLLPYDGELRSIVDGDYGNSMKRVNSPAQFARDYAGADYLLYWDTAGARATLLDGTPRLPQYARSVVARHLDASATPYDWDWALRADDALLARTLAVARSTFITDDHTGDNDAERNNAGGRPRDTF